MDCRESHRAEPLRIEVATTALSSIGDLRAYAHDFPYPIFPDWRSLAFTRQVADMLDHTRLRQFCEYHATEHSPNDEYEGALQSLALGHKEEVGGWMNLPGHIGWHCAARYKTYCYMARDKEGLDKALMRLYNYYGVDNALADVVWEISLAEMEMHVLTHGEWQHDKRQEALSRLSPEMLGRAMLDIGYEDWGITYGGQGKATYVARQ